MEVGVEEEEEAGMPPVSMRKIAAPAWFWRLDFGELALVVAVCRSLVPRFVAGLRNKRLPPAQRPAPAAEGTGAACAPPIKTVQPQTSNSLNLHRPRYWVHA